MIKLEFQPKQTGNIREDNRKETRGIDRNKLYRQNYMLTQIREHQVEQLLETWDIIK